jgi:hypothetical protein
MAYVYRHIRNDKNEPFYIGIGSDLNYKRSKETARRSDLWKRIATKGYTVEIMLDNITTDFAKIKEVEFIKLYGRKDLGTGCLANMTDGGDGTYGKVYGEEYRRKLSETAKNRDPLLVAEQTKRMIDARKRLIFTEQIREKLSNSHKGKIFSESHKKNLSVSKSGANNPMFGKKNDGVFKGEIIAFKDDVLVGKYDGIHKAASSLNVTATKISACLTGRRKKTGGFAFKRIEL